MGSIKFRRKNPVSSPIFVHPRWNLTFNLERIPSGIRVEEQPGGTAAEDPFNMVKDTRFKSLPSGLVAVGLTLIGFPVALGGCGSTCTKLETTEGKPEVAAGPRCASGLNVFKSNEMLRLMGGFHSVMLVVSG